MYNKNPPKILFGGFLLLIDSQHDDGDHHNGDDCEKSNNHGMPSFYMVGSKLTMMDWLVRAETLVIWLP